MHWDTWSDFILEVLGLSVYIFSPTKKKRMFKINKYVRIKHTTEAALPTNCHCVHSPNGPHPPLQPGVQPLDQSNTGAAQCGRTAEAGSIAAASDPCCRGWCSWERGTLLLKIICFLHNHATNGYYTGVPGIYQSINYRPIQDSLPLCCDNWSARATSAWWKKLISQWILMCPLGWFYLFI